MFGLIYPEATLPLGYSADAMVDAAREAAWSEVYRRSMFFALGGALLGGALGYALAKKRKGRGVAIGATAGGVGVGGARLLVGWRQVEAATAVLDAMPR
jgi:hypothetical protein